MHFNLKILKNNLEEKVKSIAKLTLILYSLVLFGGTAAAAQKEAAAEKQPQAIETQKKPEARKAKKENTLKKYVKKGKLSEAEAAKIKEEIKNELKNEIISEIKAELKEELKGDLKADVKQEIQAEAKIEKSKEVEIAKKSKEKELSISGYTQVQYTDNNAAGNSSSFNVARTRMIVKKKVDDKLSFFLQTNLSGNAANNANSSSNPKLTLLDATVNYQATPDLEIKAGQFVIPYGLEVPLGPKNLYMINYSQVGANADHEIVGDDQRDTGLMFTHKKKDSPFTYYLSATNGEGINRRNDSNDSKTVSGKISYAPNAFWQFGVSALSGKRYKAASTAAAGIALYGTQGGATPAQDFKRNGAGFDFKYKKDRWYWQGEYQWLRTGLAGRLNDLKGRGGYLQGGYMMTKTLELALKEDIFTPDADNGATKRTIHAAGLNWYFVKNAKWQILYENRKETPEVKNDFWASQLQLEF